MVFKRKVNKRIFFLVIFLVTIVIFSLILFLDPVKSIKRMIKVNNCNEIVSYYNTNQFEQDKQIEINYIVIDYVNEIMFDWNEGNITYNQAKLYLGTLKKVKEKEIACLAQKNLSFIIVEETGNEILEEAENAYEDKEYIQVMKCLDKVDQTYSQYSLLGEMYDECKTILLKEVKIPETVSEYEKAIDLLNFYIKEIDDNDFVAKKDLLEKELNNYLDIFNILSEATALYEKESFKESFVKLEQGIKKYPDNRKIQYAISAYQYAYVLYISEQVVTLAENDNYEEAVELLEKALDIYDCEELQELLAEAKLKTDLLFATKIKLSNAGDYIFKSAKKMVLGDFADDEQDTLLSLGGSVAASLMNIDAPLDVRDFAYDVIHWGEGDYFAARLALDAVGIIPIIGAIKYIRHTDTASDIAKALEKGEDALDTVRNVNKTVDVVSEASKKIDNLIDTADVISDVKKKTEVVSDLTKDYSDFENNVNALKKTINMTNDFVNNVEKVHYKPISTKNQAFVNKVHPRTGIKFVRKYLDLSDGRHLVGVFPQFDSYADIMLPEKYIKASFDTQKKYLNQALKEMADTPTKKKQFKIFTKEQLKDIEEGVIPEGFVWHHNENEGLMQLVDESKHAATAHDGGMSIWGNGY